MAKAGTGENADNGIVDVGTLKKSERLLERLFFSSRWITLPCYLGFIVVLAMIAVKFWQELVHAVPQTLDLKPAELIVIVLNLVDMVLLANLVIMVAFSSYENFVSRIHTGESKERLQWMGKVGFGAIKLKLVASIVAISGIHLLKVFMNVERYDTTEMTYMIAIHMAFVLSGVLLAAMDKISGTKNEIS